MFCIYRKVGRCDVRSMQTKLSFWRGTSRNCSVLVVELSFEQRNADFRYHSQIIFF